MRQSILAGFAVLAIALGLSFDALAQEAPKPKFELDGNKLTLPSHVIFKTASDEIDESSKPALEHVVAYLKDKTYITTLRIESHTDTDLAPDAALELTLKRSMAVAKWLVKNGVDCKRLLPVGFGQDKPVASNKTAEGKAENRRTEFHNAALKGIMIGGMPADGGGVVAGDPCK